jgi:hypothetical protein
MPIELWFGLLVGTSTLVGLFGGYFNKPEQFGKRMFAFLVGVIIFFTLAAILPRAEEWMVVALIGYLLFNALVFLGIFLGVKLREYFDRSNIHQPVVKPYTGWYD